jgi:DNA-binding response OmpR family regulator
MGTNSNPFTRRRLIHAWKDSDPPRTLILTNDDATREMLATAMGKIGFAVTTERHDSTDGKILGGSAINRSSCYDVMILDTGAAGVISLKQVDRVRGKGFCPAVIIIASSFDERVYEEAERLDCVTVFKRPLSVERLLYTVEAASTWSRMLLSLGYRNPKMMSAAAGQQSPRRSG